MKSFGVNFLGRFIIWREKHLSHKQFVYILAFVIGLVSGSAAVLLKNSVHYVHHFITHNQAFDHINILYLVTPVIGILLTILYVKYIVKDDIGHGITKILFSISKKGCKIKSHNNYSSLIASTLTVGFGGSVGLEAPIVLTGSSMGSTFGQLFKLNYKTKTVLVGCGAAGAIAGIFKAPIAGVIFALEVLMLDLTMWSLVPLLISAVTGLLVSYFFLEKDVIFHFEYTYEFMLKNTPYYVVLGIFTGLASAYFTRTIRYIEGQFRNIKNTYLKWIVGGSLLGLLILFLPPLYGEGYETLNALLSGNPNEITHGSLFYNSFDNFWLMGLFLLLILIFKVMATAVTTASGGVGGIFAPTLFMGGISGYLVARILNVFDFIKVSERNFALVGMAGMMAGVMHAPLTAVFLIAEITGGYGLFIPLIISATFAYITIRQFEPHSLYHLRLAERKELITHHKDQAVLTLIDVGSVIEKDFEIIHPNDTLRDLVDAISRSQRNIFPVVKDKILVGVIVLGDIRHIIFNTEFYDSIYMRDLMYLPPAYVEADEPMDEVMQKFEETNSWNLPVLKKGEYIGFLSKSKLFSAYRQQLMEISGE